ncbi:hypothetical protein [Streptomyces sp. NBC_00986]|uniref:hypothetical protein n=1 Tax=Streptomyces sp. NBC_00986 TaxID=2903702 RepID=UPI00386EA474|nr:hypothetical protein OG504_46105 [Streptomyces sp. NBC_00986]
MALGRNGLARRQADLVADVGRFRRIHGGSYKNKALGVFLLRSGLLDYDHRDLDAQKKLLLDAFAGHTEWKIPQLLDAVRADPELYFDSVSQIHMPTWHRGRIALVGDAAHFLAEELEDAGGDHTVAFERYEQRQRP